MPYCEYNQNREKADEIKEGGGFVYEEKKRKEAFKTKVT